MNQLSTLKRRQKLLVALKKVVSANKVIGTVFYQKARNCSSHLDSYCNILLEGLVTKALTLPEIPSQLFQKPAIGKRTLIVFGGDKGFCGGFNQQIAQATKKHTFDEMHIFGHKAATYLNMDARSSLDPDPDSLLKFSQDIIDSLEAYSSITCLYHDNRTVVSHELLPLLNPEILESADNEAYINEDDNDISDILRLFFASKIYYRCKQAQMHENLERMIAMTSALKNCNESLNSIVIQRNKLRQQSITQSLLEIISGY